MLIEFTIEEFQFYKDRLPTGQYARGRIIKEYADGETFLVECFSDGVKYEVKRNEFKFI